MNCGRRDTMEYSKDLIKKKIKENIQLLVNDNRLEEAMNLIREKEHL